MVKTEDSNKETLTTAGLRYETEGIVSVDTKGNVKCSRCGWTHTIKECAEYRLAHSDRELEKINRFLYTGSCVEAIVGETPVDTLLRGYRKLHADQTHAEVTELLKEE